MFIDLAKNLQYYNSEQSIPCDCEVCKNYYRQVEERYPDIASYLSSINVNILRPFELIWFENEKNNEIEYVGCQYIVFGSCDSNFTKRIGNILLEINTNNHPSDAHITDKHFILDFGKIILNRN